MKLFLLAILFCVTAALYASVGFGGGSTYTALLIVAGTDYRLIPLVALSCNIAVVSGNSWRYAKAGLVPWRRVWPLIAFSIPAAAIGGRLDLSEFVFIGLLWVALAVAGLRLLGSRQADIDGERMMPIWQSGTIGAAIGFYAGLVGIGGGIFLAPMLYALKWGRAHTIAATCSMFILVNSLAGLAGQSAKLVDTALLSDALTYWPLLPAVIIGGFFGNHLGLTQFSPVAVKRWTGVLILVVALRLAWRWVGMM